MLKGNSMLSDTEAFIENSIWNNCSSRVFATIDIIMNNPAKDFHNKKNYSKLRTLLLFFLSCTQLYTPKAACADLMRQSGSELNQLEFMSDVLVNSEGNKLKVKQTRVLYEVPSSAIRLYNCSPEYEDCFAKSIKFFTPYKLTANAREASLDASADSTLSPTKILISGQQKQPLTILAIPGLYSNSNQYNNLIKMISKNFSVNVISLSLPGHGDTAFNAASVSYIDWLLFAKKSLQLAHALGERVIVMGHSLGGLTAYWLSLIDPTNVDGLYLLDPALGVTNKSYYLTCLARYTMPFAENAQDYGVIAELFSGQSFENLKQPINAHMGCEVYKLSKYILGLTETGETDKGETDLERFAHLAKRNSEIPIFIGYSESDSLIDTDYIKLFIQNYPGPLQSVSLEQFDLKLTGEHGAIQSVLERETVNFKDSSNNNKVLENKSLVELMLKVCSNLNTN